MRFTVEQHASLGRVAEVVAAPCGSWLAVTLQRPDRDGAKYVSDLWRVPTDGGPALQLTRGESKDHAPRFRHDGALAFLSNRTPNEIKPDAESAERNQVWLLPQGGGEPRQLTDQPLGVSAFRCAKRAARMVLLAPVLSGVEPALQRETAAKRGKGGPSARRFRSQPVRHWDEWLHQNPDFADEHLFACDAEGGKPSDLTPAARGEFSIDPGFDISPDGARVVATQISLGKDRILDSALLLIEVDSASRRVLGAADSVTLDEPAFAPDGLHIAAVRTARSVAQAMQPRMALIEVRSGHVRELGQAWDGWAGAPQWSPTGRQLYFCADEGGRAPIFALDTVSGVVERVEATAGGVYEQLSVLEDGRLAGIHSTLLMAPECFLLAPQATTQPVTLARLSGFEGAQEWAQVEDFSVSSTDGTAIQGFLVRPKGADCSSRLPLSLWIHGGPIGANHDGWHWRWNPLLLVAQGYAVALPNPRGSTGFGQKFIQGIWGNVWGDQCFKDLMCVTDTLCARRDIDPQRTMAMGGSFGGYMTNWIGTQTARFKCLITHASIATMAQFTGATDHPGWWYLQMGGENPYLDQERFDRYAPIRQVGNWRSPVLIIHGERDYRCPINEGLNLFEALQYHGVTSELLVFPDENHWILKPRNVIAWYQAVIEFTARYLGAETTSVAP